MVLLTIALIKLRGGGPTTVGVVTTIAAVGGLGGALAAPILARHFKTRTLVITMAWLVVLVAVGLAAAPRPWEIGLVGALAVFLVVPLNVMLESYQLRVVPDAMLGRVAAALSFSSSGLLWTAPLTTGVLADNFGTPTAMLVVAGILAALAIWCTLAKAPREMDLRTPMQQSTGPSPDDQSPGSSTQHP
jgi:predicted neutral ceramidase superfamily lipid hydrolase